MAVSCKTKKNVYLILLHSRDDFFVVCLFIPYLGDYFLAMIAMVCVSVVTTVMVIHISAKTGPVSYWVQVVFLRWLAHVTCMYHEELDQSPPDSKLLHDSSTTECTLNLFTNHDVDGMPGNKTCFKQNGGEILDSVAEDLHFIREDIEGRNMEEQTSLQWKHVGRVVDRCLLLIFLTYAMITSLVLIMRARGPTKNSDY